MAPSLHLHAPHLHHTHPHGSSAPAPSTGYANASPKGQHYASTLDTIRRLALWTSAAPALPKGAVNWNAAPTTTNAAAGGTATAGAGMDWNEVLRKFRKHNPNRSITAAAAAAERTIRCLLSKAPASRPTFPRDITPAPPPPLPPRIVSATDVAAASEALAQLRNTLRTAQGTPTEVNSARVVLAFGEWSVGNADQALLDLGTVEERGLPRAGVPSEGYDLTLRVLAYAVEGYGLESLGRSKEALAAYARAGELYQAAIDALAAEPDRDGNDISLHRTGGDVLIRVALGTRASNSTEPGYLDTSYSAHRAYLVRSTSCARSAAAFSVAARLTMHRSFRSLQTALSRWDPELVSQNDRGQEQILRRTTGLPKAGETNREYLQFLDEVVQGWKGRGAPRAGADEVIEILYNALTHTFQSQLLLRHLIRALTIAGRYDEATKALRLYRELWDKARETDAKEVAKEMRELRSRAMQEATAPGDDTRVAGEKESVAATQGKDSHTPDAGTDSIGLDEPFAVDMDSDAVFIETAVFGVRLLCRYFGDRAADAVELATRAKAVFDEGKDDSLKTEGGKIEADLERALGAALGALARQDPNGDRRANRHSQSLDHLHRAVSLVSNDPLNHHALAYHLLEQRRVSEALESAREAARLDPTWKEPWHLLALCVSAQRDMRGALEVLETAIELGEVGDHEGDILGRRRWDHPTDATERLAVEMQLRLTRNAVIEYLDGPAAALVDQQEILAFFATAYAPIAATTRGAPAARTPQAPSSRKGDLNGAGPSGLAPPTGGAVSRAASILSRRRSSKKRTSPPSGSAVGSIPPLHASAAASELDVPSGSAVSTPARSVVDGSAAPSVRTAVSATASRGPVSPSSETVAAVPVRPSARTDPLATKLVVGAWLASAASFRRAGKLDEARGAVSEAEALDVDDADVWTQYALVLLAGEDRSDRGEQQVKDALTRAMAIDPEDVPMTILTARRFLTPPPSPPLPTSSGGDSKGSKGGDDGNALQDEDSNAAAPTWQRPLATDWLALQVPLAESMLEAVVVREGYDVAEAWFELSRCYQLTRRPAQEKECLVRALELERTRPVRVLGKAVQRFV